MDAATIRPKRVLFIDNFDSFIYNLVEEFYCMGAAVEVVRNDISHKELLPFMDRNDLVVLSPGPGAPEAAGICVSLIQRYSGVLPIIGICLGHQAIVHAYGGRIAPADIPVHGKVAKLYHNHEYFFAGLPNPLSVGRYHSLVATEIPAALSSIATSDGLSMCVLDAVSGVLGFQFHPESILTPQGSTLLRQASYYLIERFANKRRHLSNAQARQATCKQY